MATVRVQRQSSRGTWHEVKSAVCEECGCPYQYAVDDPYLIWEPGDEVQTDCLDPLCDCHVLPARSWALRHDMDERRIQAAGHRSAS